LFSSVDYSQDWQITAHTLAIYRSSSPTDMTNSDEDDEDGQISRMELLYKPNPGDEPTLEDLEKCRLPQDMLATAS
jgi:hypothetical protein